MVICMGQGADLHGPAGAAASHCLLLQEIRIGFGFTFLVPAHPGSPGQNPESRETVVVVVVVVWGVYSAPDTPYLSAFLASGLAGDPLPCSFFSEFSPCLTTI